VRRGELAEELAQEASSGMAGAGAIERKFSSWLFKIALTPPSTPCAGRGGCLLDEPIGDDGPRQLPAIERRAPSSA
jgi:hypothetical protein